MCGVDCWIDHRLRVSKLNLTVQPQKRPQGQKLPKKLNVAKLHDQVVKEAIQDRLNKELDSKPVDVNDIGGEWHKFSNTVYTVLKETLGTPSRKHQDWFDDQDAEIQNRLEAKHQLFRSHLNDPNSASKRDAYLKAKQDCQRDLRRKQNDWFRNKSEDIERHAASNNSRLISEPFDLHAPQIPLTVLLGFEVSISL